MFYGHYLVNSCLVLEQTDTLKDNLEKRIVQLETALTAWFSRADESHATAAGSIASLHDGVWKGFDDAAKHRRELAAALKVDVLTGLCDHVESAVAPVVASTKVLQKAFDAAIVSSEAPIRKAADTSLALLPEVAGTLSLLAATTRELQGAVSEVHNHAHSARTASASAESGVKELLSAHTESAKTVRTLAGRHAGVSREDVEAAVRSAHAELKAALSEAHANTGAAVDSVHGSVKALTSAHQAGVGDAAAVAQTITGLRNDMWKGFDDAATHRRELASSSMTEVRVQMGDAASTAHATNDKVQEVLSLWKRLEASLDALQVGLLRILTMYPSAL